MSIVTALLRFFSYLYHGFLALVLLALGTVLTLANAGNAVRLDMLPWSGPTIVWVVLLSGIVGLVLVVLAARGKFRPLFFLWALIIPIYLVRGYILGGYRFSPDEFSKVVCLVLGSFVALLGAFLALFHRPAVR